MYKRGFRMLVTREAKQWCITCVVGLFMVFGLVKSHAISEEEYEVLAELSYAIDNLYPIILKGKNKQSNKGRVYFDWNKLKEELSVIQTGVLESFEEINSKPRAIKPLSGDYLQ